ncbi:MAG: tRNA lysidine(34) synthetase TilS [Pseudomonadota bacterium]
MFQPQDSVLVGVSGGPDSVALLHVLSALASRFSLRLGVAHLNHGLRQHISDSEAEFVASLSENMALPFFLEKADVRKYQAGAGLSLEEAARHVRYAFYRRTARENRFSKIALGHHADDNAELVLMNLMRGSGPLGISGIPPVRNGSIVRPLIRVKRSEIMEFLNTSALKYVSDETNREIKYLRNRIRHHLMPVIKSSFNPRIVETLDRLSSILRSEEEWIESIIERDFKTSIVEEKDNSIAFSAERLGKIHIAARRRLIRKAVSKVKGNLRSITYAHINSVMDLLQDARPPKRLDLPGRVRVSLKGDRIVFSQEHVALRTLDANSDNNAVNFFEYEIKKPGSIFIKEINARVALSEIGAEDVTSFRNVGPGTGFMDMAALTFPLVLRNFRPGDRFAPLGLSGTKKVKKYFIDTKVPVAERLKCPILLSRNRIIWVAGHRIDESVKLNASTRNVLKAELLLA